MTMWDLPMHEDSVAWVAGIGASGREQDVRLAARMAAGDAAALQEVLDTHGDRLKRLLGRLTANHEEAEDLLQDVLLAAWSGARRYRGDAGLYRWLEQIAINHCRNRQRSLARWRRFLAGWIQRREDRSPKCTQQTSADRDAVDHALRRLGHADREILVLVYLEPYELPEVAERLNIKLATLHVRLHRARKRMQAELALLDYHP